MKNNNYTQPKRSKRPKPFIIQDNYFQRAKKEWYRARSAYKLLEIQEKFDLIKSGMNICDIWAAPGSFLQVIRKIIKDSWVIVWIDIQDIEPLNFSNIHLIKDDIFEFETLKNQVTPIIWLEWKFDLITSDIAPKTTGRKDVDQYASVELNIEIINFSRYFLKRWGNLLLKVFRWEDFDDLLKEIKKEFNNTKIYKPLACRDRSFEEYVICLGKK